jgi:hypothetical protein
MYFGEIYLFQNSPVQPLIRATLTETEARDLEEKYSPVYNDVR